MQRHQSQSVDAKPDATQRHGKYRYKHFI